MSEESSLITETSNNLTSSQEAAKSSKGVTTVVLNSSSEVKSVEEKEINVAPHCKNIRVQTSPPTNELSSAVQQPEVKMTSTSDMCDKINNTLQDKIKIELNCPVCHIDIEVKEDGLCCDSCHCWFHKNCLHSAEITGDAKSKDSSKWICVRCQSILANRVKWGDLTGEMVIAQKIKLVYEEVITWSKNFFLLPRGKVGTDFIKELTKLFRLFNEKDKKWSRLALPLVHIFLPLMLQKPSKKSKAKDNIKYLQKRLEWWYTGNIKSLLSEAREIQKRLSKGIVKRKETREKAFCRLMLLGKVGQAMKFINNEDVTLGVHHLSDQVVDILEKKHPEPELVDSTVMLPPQRNDPEPVIFEIIDGENVYKTAKMLQGSGGPTLVDAELWKHILCSKSYGKFSKDLCEEIANMTKILCTEIVHPDCLKEFTACRLIPLDKGEDKFGNPGVRPVGVGEVIRRLTGKMMVKAIRNDIINAAGPLQTCAGLQCGIEASIHSMREIYQTESTEGVLLVDADNAFNRLNRKVAINNIKNLCPAFHRYLDNTYKYPSKLHMKDDQNKIYRHILSKEGSTQGDVAAMAMYALGTRPLLDELKKID